MKYKEVKNKLHMESQVRTLSLKFYEEQLPNGEDVFIENLKNINKDLYQVVAIKHDADLVKNDNDPFEVSGVKSHWHLYLRVMDNKHKPRIKQLLKMLGVEYRPSVDVNLWNNRGVETCGNFTDCVMYGLHKTPKAQFDGKHEYDVKDYVSNLTINEIEQIMQGYKRLEDESRRPSNRVLAELAETAEQLGYELKDFDKWWHDLPFVIKSHSKMKYVKELYDYGVKRRIEDDKNVTRLCIFIQGEANRGKTYSAMEALKGKKVLVVGGGGSGKYDNIKPTTDAIIIDDDVAPNLLNMSDNYMCSAYRRNSNNPYWCGEYFIITSNKTFDEYMDDCKISERHYGPLKSRFYICEVCGCVGEDFYHLSCKSPSKRGTLEEQEKRLKMFMDFRKAFNESMKNYTSETRQVDYSKINDGYREMTEEERNKYKQTQEREYIRIKQKQYLADIVHSMTNDELQKLKNKIDKEYEEEDVDKLFDIK